MKVTVEFTGIELDHLLTLLRDSSQDGSYYGQRTITSAAIDCLRDSKPHGTR